MKKLLIAAMSLLAVVAAQAQGTYAFGNRSTPDGIDAPVMDGTGARLSGDAFLMQLWAGPDGSSLAAASAPVPFRTGAAIGYIATSTATAANVLPGATGTLELRVWRKAAGADFAAALASSDADPLGNWLRSDQLKIAAGGVLDPITGIPGFPAPLKGLVPATWQEGGKLHVVPEPSVIALGVLGGLALLIRRRK